jgi:hypothetical protein
MRRKIKKVTDYLIKCNEESTDKLLYNVGILSFICVCVTAAAVIIIKRFTGLHVDGCLFYSITGFYCPGCGGTRSVIYLFQGKIIKSIEYNAFATYLSLLYIIYMASWSLFYITKGKVKGLKFRIEFVYLGIVVLIIQWLIKNLLLTIRI